LRINLDPVDTVQDFRRQRHRVLKGLNHGSGLTAQAGVAFINNKK
jgi:hypothetical protein